jgi:hypothetical protein
VIPRRGNAPLNATRPSQLGPPGRSHVSAIRTPGGSGSGPRLGNIRYVVAITKACPGMSSDSGFGRPESRIRNPIKPAS